MKTAVITGASYGIGKGIAETLLGEGWKVYGLSRTKPEIASEHFVWIKCDLANADSIAACVGVVSEPTVDALVSNAGVIYVENASAVSRASYEKTFSVNVLAPMLLVNALREKIVKSVIISVSSVSDRIAEPDVALYCSSKAANTLYFNALAAELQDAKVMTLLPDYVDTPMLHSTMDSNKNFDWSATIRAEDVASLSYKLITGAVDAPSGANIIIVTEKLKDDLQSVEKLYGFNTDTGTLTAL